MDIVVKGAESVTVFDKNLAMKIIEPGPPQKADVLYVRKKVSKLCPCLWSPFKVQGDNRGSFIVVPKRFPNMSKNHASTVLVKLVAIFDHQEKIPVKNCNQIL